MTDTAPSPGLFLGQSSDGATPQAEILLWNRANRHGVIAGATGTGKTVTLQIMAQGFSEMGVPVFCADVKGDLSGISQVGTPNEKLLARAAGMNLTLTPKAAPTVFWDLYGQKGHPVRATVSEIGPLLMALMLDLDDLRSVLTYVAENAARIGREVGNVAPASVAAIQRGLLQLEQQGGDAFFGEPALKLEDMMKVGLDGKGQVNVLDSTRLMSSPRLYGAFLLWLLSELFEQLPEVGDPDKPRLVFFFDEAHLLFKDAPRPLLEKVEQVVRLIRSKGVGIFFITQNPADIPDSVLAQLGNRIQHALRAYTPSEQRGLKSASESFRANPAFDTAEAIQALGTGEALVSTLDEKGAPRVVARTLIRPPDSRLGPATDAERAAVMASSPVKGVYDTLVDRESAEEILAARHAKDDAEVAPAPAPRGRAAPVPKAPPAPKAPRKSNRQTPLEALTKSVLRTAGSTLTRELLRGVLGGLRRR